MYRAYIARGIRLAQAGKWVMTTQQRVHAHIEGRVQGVGFRYFVQTEAQKLDVTGWVRNRWNGGVEVVAEGDADVLETFIGVLRRGPSVAWVTNFQHHISEATEEFKRFSVRRTA